MQQQQQDAGQNENENHLIGNILAEEDDENEGSDIEESKLLSATTGGGNYNNNASAVTGSSSNVGGVSPAGFGAQGGKLTAFGGASGGFGLPGSSAYGGAFNNSGIPDRVGSTTVQDLNQKYYDSPQAKKLGSHFGTNTGQNPNNLTGGTFQNLFTTTQDPFGQGGNLDPLMRRSSGMDLGFGNVVSNQNSTSDGKPLHMNLHSMLSPIGTGSSAVGSNNFGQTENTGSNMQGSQPFLEGVILNSVDNNQQNIYATKEYYEYFHGLKGRDPRLPTPQYTPTPAELNEQALKNVSSQNTEDIEKKLNQLQLNTASADSSNGSGQNLMGQSFGLLQGFSGKPQGFMLGQQPQHSQDQTQLPFPLQQYPVNPLMFGAGPQVPINLIQQPQASQQSTQALLQQLTQQHMSSTPQPNSQQPQSQTQNSNQPAANQSNQHHGRAKKGKKGVIQEPPPMPKPPQQKQQNPILNSMPVNAQASTSHQNRLQTGAGQGFGQINPPNQFTPGQLGGISQMNSNDTKLGVNQGWTNQSGFGAMSTNMNPFLLQGSGGQSNQMQGAQNLQGNLMQMANSNNQQFSNQVNMTQSSLSQGNTLIPQPLYGNSTSNFTYNTQDQQQAALLMQNYAAMGMSMPQYAAAMQQMMSRMLMGQNMQYANTQPNLFGAATGQQNILGAQQPLNMNQFGTFAGTQGQTFNANTGVQGSQDNIGSQNPKKGQYNQMPLNSNTVQIKGGSNQQNMGRGANRGGSLQGVYSGGQVGHGGRGNNSQAVGSFGQNSNRGNEYGIQPGSNPLYSQPSMGRIDSQYGMNPLDHNQMAGGIIQQAKSEFLEDLRNKIQTGKKIEIKDIKGHVVECSNDQYGSRFIQQKYDVTTEEEKELIFSEILSDANNLMNDVFGNYVVQKLFEYGTEFQRATLAEQLLGNVLKLTKSMYGCRVVQKALEVISLEQKKLLVQELKDAVVDCIYDQNGNHVIQKCIERMPSDSVDFIVQTVLDQPHLVRDLCLHTYGCRVIQRILENCEEKQTKAIIDSILADIQALTKDQFGNYVIQHILEQGKNQEDKNRIVKSIKGRVIELSNHKFASNVVEKCLQHGSEKDKKEIIDEFLESNYELGEEITSLGGPQLNGALYTMMKDRYGNYVIQKCIEVSKGKQREILIKKITACANVLRKQQNYSRHVYNFIEKFCPIDGGNVMLPDNEVNGSQDSSQYLSQNVNSRSRGGGGYGNNYVDNQNSIGGSYHHGGYTQHHSSQGGHHYVQKKQQSNSSGNTSQKKK